jgi:hypothetical protein
MPRRLSHILSWQEVLVSSNKMSASEKIDKLASAAKHKVESVIDDAHDVAASAAAKARKHVHDAGEKVKEAGEKIQKMVD